MKDRRTKLRRERDKDLEDDMKALRNDFQAHVIDCTRTGLLTQAKLDEYHAQNKAKLETIKQVNDEQISMLQALVSAKRVTVWTGMAIKWLSGLLAAAAGALGLYTFFKPN